MSATSVSHNPQNTHTHTHTPSHPTGKCINSRWSKQTQSWLRPRASAGKIGGLTWQMEILMCLRYIGFSFEVTAAKFWGWMRGWGVGQKASKRQNDSCHLGNKTHEQGRPSSSPWLLPPSTSDRSCTEQGREPLKSRAGSPSVFRAANGDEHGS